MSLEIAVRVVPDRGNNIGTDFRYPRVVGFTDPGSGEYVPLADIPVHLREAPGEERALELPTGLGRRFVQALHNLSDPDFRRFNCHRFASFITGADDYHSALANFDGQRPPMIGDGRLGLGKIGMIGSSMGLKPFHSVVGLGPDSTESLQVLSRRGELTVVETGKVLESYRGWCATSTFYEYDPDLMLA